MQIEAMNELLLELEAAEAVVDEVKAVLKEKSATAESLRSKILQTLAEAKVDKFAGTNGTASIATRYQVRMPHDYAVKQELKAFLLERDAFDALWSINHQTLNSWFKSEVASAQEEGKYLDIPGLETTSESYLMFRRKR